MDIRALQSGSAQQDALGKNNQEETLSYCPGYPGNRTVPSHYWALGITRVIASSRLLLDRGNGTGVGGAAARETLGGLVSTVENLAAHGYDPGDPAFGMVELTRVVLEELIEESAGRIAERLDTLPERIHSSGKALAAEVASQGMQRVVEMLGESRRAIAADTEQAQFRITEQTERVNKDLARQVAQIVHAAQTLSRGVGVRTRWFVAGAFVTAQLVPTASLSGVHR